MAKYREEYQIKNRAGEPIGPPQVFEAETKDELIEKIRAAHQNSAAEMYETKRAAKLGIMLEPDPDQPIPSFEERLLTADERVRIADQMKNPATAYEANKTLVEALLGAPIETVRENLRQTEVYKRADFIREQVQIFKDENPDYVESETNRDTLRRYLAKKDWPMTHRNLGIAFAELKSEEGLLVVRAAKTPEVEAGSPTAASVTPPAPVVETEITVPPTTATPISATPAVVRPTVSSSGIRRSDSSVGATPTVIKPGGITIQEVNALSADQYAKRLRDDPSFKEQVEALFVKPAK